MIHQVMTALALPKKQVSFKVQSAVMVNEAESLEFLGHILHSRISTRQGVEICISTRAIVSGARRYKF